MLRVPIREARPGMRLAMPVLHPRSALVLLSSGYELDWGPITRLGELSVHEVWIDYPGTELIRQYVSPVIAEHRGRLVEKVAGLFEVAHEQAHARVDYGPYRDTLRDLIESLVSEPLAAAYVTELAGAGGCELRHATEVCLISVLMGLKLEGYLENQRKRLQPRHARNVVSLGLGAMLHDVGMTRVPIDVRQRYEQTRDDSDRTWRQHVLIGHKMVTGAIEPAAAGVVLHHHQHFDGSGFPGMIGPSGLRRGLRGEAIHVFARIVCVANSFDRLRRRSDGTLVPRVRVLREMIHGQWQPRFDPVVLSALTQVVPAYPPGSVVRLSTGERAVVMNWRVDHPCRPIVQILRDDPADTEQDADGMTRDLLDQRAIVIAQDDEQDVAVDNFALPESSQSGQSAA